MRISSKSDETWTHTMWDSHYRTHRRNRCDFKALFVRGKGKCSSLTLGIPHSRWRVSRDPQRFIVFCLCESQQLNSPDHLYNQILENYDHQGEERTRVHIFEMHWFSSITFSSRPVQHWVDVGFHFRVWPVAVRFVICEAHRYTVLLLYLLLISSSYSHNCSGIGV